MQSIAKNQNELDSIADEVVRAVESVLGPTAELIALHEPEFAGNEWKYVKECIDTGWVSSAGRFVDRFERDLATYTGSPHAIATVNGTAALHLCLKLAGVEADDEVIIPTLTFVATANAVSYCGANPHFVDVSELNLGVDPVKLDQYLAEILENIGGYKLNRKTGKRVSAVVVMHAFGHPAEIEQICDICARHGLPIIEDAAESLGSMVQGRHCGTFGLLSAISFNGNKLVTTGGGGAILTNDTMLARKAKHLSTTAKLPHAWLYAHDDVGFNYRMPNLNAALGCAQLEKIDEFINRKRALAASYKKAFEALDSVRFISEAKNSQCNYWLNAIIIEKAENFDIRDLVLKKLNDMKYMARPSWMLMHKLLPYGACERMSDMSVAEGIEQKLINLPSSPKLANKLG